MKEIWKFYGASDDLLEVEKIVDEKVVWEEEWYLSSDESNTFTLVSPNENKIWIKFFFGEDGWEISISSKTDEISSDFEVTFDVTERNNDPIVLVHAPRTTLFVAPERESD